MSRPRIPDIDRLANKLWLAKLLMDWRQREEAGKRRFSLSGVAKQLLAVSDDPDAERGHGRERLQALTTIRRTGSDPRKCLRFLTEDQLPSEISLWAFELTARRQASKRRGAADKRPRSSKHSTLPNGKRVFQIDAVARAEQWFPSASAWYRPVLMLALRPPGLSRDNVRALAALELARLGFLRPETMEQERERSLLRRGIISEEDSRVASRWADSLRPLCKTNTIEAVGVMALLLHEARICFAPEQVCFAIYLALDQAIDKLFAAPELQEFAAKIHDYVNRYLWSQRWEDSIDSPRAYSLTPPLSVKQWLNRCEQKPWWKRGSGLPDVPEISDLGMATVDALRARVEQLRSGKETKKALHITGVTELECQIEPTWNRIKNGEIDQPIKRARSK